MTTATDHGGAHILVIPYPAKGHMIPMLDLTHLLANHGLIITILVTPNNLPFLNPLLSSNPSIQTLVFPFPSHSSIPTGVETVSDLPPNKFRSMIYALGFLYDPLLNWFKSQSSPPVAVISDMFMGWTHHLAIELNVKRFVFSPSGALGLSTMYSLWRRLPKLDDGGDQTAVISFPEIPNCPKYPWWQLSTLFRSYKEGDPVSEFIKDGFRGNMASWGLVINSFSELERVYVESLSKEFLGHDRLWTVGPLLPLTDDDISYGGPKERGGFSSVSAVDIMSWLDTCHDHKVIYLCFGSQAVLTNKQMEGLALGLEKSGAKFIWCVKEPTKGHVEGEYGMIPSGFEDRVVGRGLVIRGWAPQVLILSHRAVGVFLTHCGWNSVLESLVAGVPMLAWPRGADQFVNATLIVEELKVGLTVCEGAETIPDSDELGRIMEESVSEKWVVRERVKEISKAANETVNEGGSSYKDLVGLVNHLCILGRRPNT